MTDNKELIELIRKIKVIGGNVTVTYDNEALQNEGRQIIDTVQISGVKGIGPYPMSAIGAAESMRRALFSPKQSRSFCA